MVICGHSEDELKKLSDNSIDLIITSPPYADRRKNVYGGVSEDKYVDWFKPIAIEIKRVLKPTGSFFLNIKTSYK
jgi:site-specific DNA-methyltransferase (adenine-specific)/site-specific DNA-methyltransferase (cytosine-N4-specific)